jgi:hypothetical protein
MYRAREIVQNMLMVSGEEQREFEALKEGVKPQWMENWFDGLTYCPSPLFSGHPTPSNRS